MYIFKSSRDKAQRQRPGLAIAFQPEIFLGTNLCKVGVFGMHVFLFAISSFAQWRNYRLVHRSG